MTTSTSIYYTSSVRTSTLTHGLLPSSLEPLSHGLGTSIIFREVQVPRRPKEMKTELREMETWQMDFFL